MIYDIPVRSGRKMESATMLRLAGDVANVLALKDAAGNPGAPRRRSRARPTASRSTAATTR